MRHHARVWATVAVFYAVMLAAFILGSRAAHGVWPW